jgi:hypothetical protein
VLRLPSRFLLGIHGPFTPSVAERKSHISVCVQHTLHTAPCSRAAQDTPNCEAELAFQRRLAH